MACIILLGMLAGCASTNKYGAPPKVDRLDTLKRGISGESDVLKALGEARGYGQVSYSHDIKPRKIWFYDYTEAQGRKIGLKFLLVFFDQELYDGHLWFSSAHFLEIEE